MRRTQAFQLGYDKAHPFTDEPPCRSVRTDFHVPCCAQGLRLRVELFVGYEAEPTPEGVARATTTTVVVASLAVLGLDFILTALMFSTN